LIEITETKCFLMENKSKTQKALQIRYGN
jgi:hypothetical protein